LSDFKENFSNKLLLICISHLFRVLV
jgi:hypothetical protein